MTMATVGEQTLEAIASVGRSLDRILKRIESLEAEVGMEADPDDDEAKKKAEAAMADDDDPDKDPDKDRGRSTRAPGQPMTRAQMHRAAKEKDKKARSWPIRKHWYQLPTRAPAETKTVIPG